MKLSKNIDELELIKNYQKNSDEKIALYFFEKYKDMALNIITSKINTKFSSIPLDREDFSNAVWKGVKIALKEFDKNKGSSFKNFLISRGYILGLKEALKFLKNTHLVLNNAYSYDSLLIKNNEYKSDASISYADTTKNFIEQVIHFNNKFNSQEIKRVIYLKSIGHSIREISELTKYPLHKVRSIISLACEIAKKLYE